MNRRGEPSSTLIASFLSIMTTLLAVIATDALNVGHAKYAVPFVYGGLVVTLLALALVSVRAVIGDLRSAQRELRLDENIHNAIPTLIQFKSRKDTLTLIDDRTAQLEWLFELTSPPDVGVSLLAFPILAEREREDESWDAVKVTSIQVNDKEEDDVEQALRPMERRISDDDKRPSTQYVLLRVPVPLGIGKTFCRVRVVMEFKDVFKDVFVKADGEEVFYVDIPYLTESLHVTIVAASTESTKPHYAVRRPLDGGAIDAISGFMETRDDSESLCQDGRCEPVDSALVWETTSPKLGYRYKVNFRTEQRP